MRAGVFKVVDPAGDLREERCAGYACRGKARWSVAFEDWLCDPCYVLRAVWVESRLDVGVPLDDIQLAAAWQLLDGPNDGAWTTEAADRFIADVLGQVPGAQELDRHVHRWRPRRETCKCGRDFLRGRRNWTRCLACTLGLSEAPEVQVEPVGVVQPELENLTIGKGER